MTSGYLKVFGLEATLFVYKEDAVINNMLNAVSVSVAKELEADIAQSGGTHVTIYGRFTKRASGQIAAGTLHPDRIIPIKLSK